MRPRFWIVLLFGGAAAACATSGASSAALPTAGYVDVPRYMGTWFEIASFPQRFQRGCTGTTASYALREDGKVSVINRCRVDGKEKVVSGVARVADPTTNAKLEVSFFPLFWADYWIVELDPDYTYAVVGHPNRKYLWILSRSPTLEPAVLEGITQRVAAKGFDVSRLQRTLQSAGPVTLRPPSP